MGDVTLPAVDPGKLVAKEAVTGLGVGRRGFTVRDWSSEDEAEPTGGRGVVTLVEMSIKSESGKVLFWFPMSLNDMRSKTTLQTNTQGILKKLPLINNDGKRLKGLCKQLNWSLTKHLVVR